MEQTADRPVAEPERRAIVYKAPVEVVSGATAQRLGAVAPSIAAAAVVMVLLGAKPLLGWANALPISEAADFVLYFADRWNELCDGIGLTRVFDGARALLRELEALR